MFYNVHDYKKHVYNLIKLCSVIKVKVNLYTTESEIIEQLKEEFHSTTQQSKKIQILTVLPKSWSIKQVQTELGTSNYMV